MNGLFKGVQDRARTLKAAFAANQAAYDAYQVAEQASRETFNPQTAHALVDAEQKWTDTRDHIITAAQALLNTANLYLLAFQGDEFPTLRKQLAYLREGFAHEVEAFKIYSSTFDDLAVAREGWEAARGEVISRAWPLVQTIEQTLIVDESSIDTDLDGTPSWQDAGTPEERDRIIYENRKQTLGAKRAGQMTYAIPRAINKRRGQV